MKDRIKELEDRTKELENQIWQQQAVIAALLEALTVNRVVARPIPPYEPPTAVPYNPWVPYMPSYPLYPCTLTGTSQISATEGNVRAYL